MQGHKKINYVELGRLFDEHNNEAVLRLNNALSSCYLRQELGMTSLYSCIRLLDRAIAEYKEIIDDITRVKEIINKGENNEV